MSSSAITPSPEESQPTTIYPEEVEQFSIKARAWWDVENGPVRALHTLNELRVPYFVEELAGHNESAALNNIKILDVGCGGGVLSEALARYGATVTGIDAAKDVIAVAIHHSNANIQLEIKPTYQCVTIEEHATKYKNHYDVVVASEIIEHVNNKELFVKACVETLKPGGSIFFTAPSKTRMSQIVNIWFAENIMNIPPRGTHQYEKFVSPDEVKTLLEINNCSVEKEIRGFMFNMFSHKWSWSRTKSLFFAMHGEKKT